MQRVIVQNGGGNCTRADVDDPELQIDPFRVIGRVRVVVLPERAVKRGLDLAVQDHLSVREALINQGLPVQFLTHLLDRGRGRATGQALHVAPGHVDAGGQDRLVRDPDRGGRLGHPVQIDQRRAFPLSRPVGHADRDGVEDRMPPVLAHEFVERGVAQTRDEDRLVMFQQLGGQEPPLQIQRHQHMNDGPREPRYRRQRTGLEDIARVCPARVQDRPDPVLGQFLAQQKRGHDLLGQLFGLQDLCCRRRGPDQPCQQAEHQRRKGVHLNLPLHARDY